MVVDLKNINVGFSEVNNNLACVPIQNLWFKFVNTGLCTELFTGFYSVWISQLVASFFLLFMIFMATFVYQYFPKGPAGVLRAGGGDFNR
jgi:hypothetical protein